MTLQSGLTMERRLELICEAVRYCRRVRDMGMVSSAWTKALREPIFFMWECRNGSKTSAARYRSTAATGLRWGRREVVYDHAIPYACVQNELMALQTPTPERVKDILDRRLISCIITREEDAALSAAGLRQRMPADWDGADPFARYRHVGIEAEPNPHYAAGMISLAGS